MHTNAIHDREQALIREALSSARSVTEIHAALVKPSVPTAVRARYARALSDEIGRLQRLGVLKQLAGSKHGAARLLSHAQVLSIATRASLNGNAAAAAERLVLDRDQTTLIREAVTAGRVPEEILTTLTAGYADVKVVKDKARLLRLELSRLDATGVLAQVAGWDLAVARYIGEIEFRCQELGVKPVAEKPRRRRSHRSSGSGSTRRRGERAGARTRRRKPRRAAASA